MRIKLEQEIEGLLEKFPLESRREVLEQISRVAMVMKHTESYLGSRAKRDGGVGKCCVI